MTTMMRRFSIRIVLCSQLVFLTSISIFAAEFAPPEDVSFTAKFDGTEQRYVQLLPADFNAANDNTLLIALHGHGSDRWQFVRDNRDECKGARDVALKYGAIYVSPDYRAKTSWMGPAAEADLAQIIELLKAKYRIRRVLLCGGSMGGSSSLTFTALHPDVIDGVASLNGTANHLEYEQFQDAISASFGGSKQTIPDEYKRRSAEYWPEKFTMPLTITTGGKDTLVPPESAIRLAKIVSKLQPNVLLIHRSEGGHSTNYDDTVAAVEYLFTRSEVH
ncbi:MAG: alpha/beta fold hydrolase [Planctomycetaceae bacterium]|nr:alpha/beta fold hydrolase [Planctomycetaceae bacterium]